MTKIYQLRLLNHSSSQRVIRSGQDRVENAKASTSRHEKQNRRRHSSSSSMVFEGGLYRKSCITAHNWTVKKETTQITISQPSTPLSNKQTNLLTF